MTTDSPTRVLVCGATFGAVYARACALHPALECVGVVTRGAAPGIALAARLGVPHLTRDQALTLDPLPDVAAVVLRSPLLGGAAVDVATSFLQAGVTTVVEQPVALADIKALTAAAREGGAGFRVGNLYANLPAVRAFLDRIAEIPRQEILGVRASAHVSALYPLAATLTRLASGGRVRVTSAGQGVAVGVLGRTPLTVTVNTFTQPGHSDGHVPKLFGVAVETTSGEVNLLSPAGPVIETAALVFGDTDARGLPHMRGDTTVREVAPATAASPGDWVADAWASAVAMDLRDFGIEQRELATHATAATNWAALTATLRSGPGQE